MRRETSPPPSRPEWTSEQRSRLPKLPTKSTGRRSAIRWAPRRPLQASAVASASMPLVHVFLCCSVPQLSSSSHGDSERNDSSLCSLHQTQRWQGGLLVSPPIISSAPLTPVHSSWFMIYLKVCSYLRVFITPHPPREEVSHCGGSLQTQTFHIQSLIPPCLKEKSAVFQDCVKVMEQETFKAGFRPNV